MGSGEVCRIVNLNDKCCRAFFAIVPTNLYFGYFAIPSKPITGKLDLSLG